MKIPSSSLPIGLKTWNSSFPPVFKHSLVLNPRSSNISPRSAPPPNERSILRIEAFQLQRRKIKGSPSYCLLYRKFDSSKLRSVYEGKNTCILVHSGRENSIHRCSKKRGSTKLSGISRKLFRDFVTYELM